MKTLKTFLVIIIPVFLMACNSQPKLNTADNKSNNNAVMTDNTSIKANQNQGKDEDFLKEAAIGGMMEVELGRYAEQSAQNQRVKSYGNMMVRDHSKVNEELKALAQKKSWVLPNAMDDNHNNKVNDLKKKQGTEFDKDYIKAMVDDHQEDVDNFKKFAENGQDPDLKAFAAKTLPILLMHQDSAKNINDAIK